MKVPKVVELILEPLSDNEIRAILMLRGVITTGKVADLLDQEGPNSEKGDKRVEVPYGGGLLKMTKAICLICGPVD